MSVSAELIGQDVKLRLKGDPYFGGVTLRWGTLAAIEPDGGVIVDRSPWSHRTSTTVITVIPASYSVVTVVP